MLGFLSHTNTIQVHLYSYYVLRITNTDTIHGSIRARYKITNQLIDPLINQCTQDKHSLWKISIKNIHTSLTQNKTFDGLDMEVQTGILSVCFFSVYDFVDKQKKRQTRLTEQSRSLWVFHDQKLWLVETRGKWLFLLLVVAGFLSLSLHESVTRKCQLVEFFLFRVLGFGNHD